jgi:hypothetical protein
LVEGPQILLGTRSTERRRDVWQQKETDNEIGTLEVPGNVNSMKRLFGVRSTIKFGVGGK